MNGNIDDREIERSLRQDPSIQPSARFVHRVMRSVRDEADRHQAIRFPWRRAGLGLALSCAVLFFGPTLSNDEILSWATDPVVLLAIQWTSLTLSGCVAVAVLSSRLVSRS